MFLKHRCFVGASWDGSVGDLRLKGAERQMECHEPPQRAQSIRKILSMPEPQFLLSPEPLTR